MRPPPPWCRPAPLARGAISWVTALLLVVVAGGAYLAWMWVPVYLLHYEVKQVVRDYIHQAIKEQNDQLLVENMLHKLRVLDQMEVPNEAGELAAVPVVQLDSDDVAWQRDTSVSPPMLHVAFEYTRWVQYPLVQRWRSTTLSIDLTEDLARPDWGPLR